MGTETNSSNSSNSSQTSKLGALQKMSWVDSSKEIETEIYSTHGFRRGAIKTQQKSVKSQKRFEMHEQYESQCVFFGVFFICFVMAGNASRFRTTMEAYPAYQTYPWSMPIQTMRTRLPFKTALQTRWIKNNKPNKLRIKRKSNPSWQLHPSTLPKPSKR